MKIIGDNVEVSDSLRQYIEAKLEGFEEIIDMANASVSVTVGKKVSTIAFLGHSLREKKFIKVRANNHDIYAACDKLHDILKEKLKRIKTLPRKKNPIGKEEFAFSQSPPHEIVVKVMSRNEALRKMSEMDFNFWLYVDKDTGRFAAMYKRDDGSVDVLYPVFE